MCVIYFVWYFSIFLLYFSKILATNIDSITSYSKIREEIKSMYVCMYVCMYVFGCLDARFKQENTRGVHAISEIQTGCLETYSK